MQQCQFPHNGGEMQGPMGTDNPGLGDGEIRLQGLRSGSRPGPENACRGPRSIELTRLSFI